MLNVSIENMEFYQLLRNQAVLCHDRLLVCLYEPKFNTSIHRYDDLK